MNKANRTAPDEIGRALRLILAPGQVSELRALDAVTASDRRPHVESGYFDDLDKLAQAATGITKAKGAYFTPNPVNPALLARAGSIPAASSRQKGPTLMSAGRVTRTGLLP